MNGLKNYKEFKLIGYDGYFYIFEEGIIFDANRNVIMIQEEEKPQQYLNKGKNISENIIQPSGLNNYYGHSCFINAFLQCLINCAPLTKYFLTKYQKTNYTTLSNIYLDFIKKYQQKDYNAAKGIVNYFLSNDSSIKNTGSDSKDVLFDFFDKIQSELKHSEISIIIDETTNPENENDVIKERINLDKADNSIINECFNFWIENEQKCYNNRCPKYYRNLYEIRSESYFVFYLSEIYNKKYSNYSNNRSGRRNGNNNKLSLDECFYYYFLEKGNCASCRRVIDVKNKICKLPNILIIVLNRGKNNYFNVNIEFNQELNLNRYYQKLEYNIDEMNHDVSPKYNLLCGTILEKDYYNPGKGHTIAFATDYHGKYTIYDDNKIKNNEEFQNIKNKDAYILFYQMEKKILTFQSK